MASLCLPSSISTDRMEAGLVVCGDGCTVICPARPQYADQYQMYNLDRAFQANRPWHCLDEFGFLYFEVRDVHGPPTHQRTPVSEPLG